MASQFEARLSEGRSPSVKVLNLEGELDEVTVEELKEKTDPILGDQGVHQLVFNLEKLRFINSKGIGYLVSVHTHMAKDGRTLVLTEASEPVMDVLSLVGLTNIIPYYATLEEALKI